MHSLFDRRTGKTTFFVANQSKLDCLPAEEIAALETELTAVEEENKTLTMELRNASAGKISSVAYAYAWKLTGWMDRTNQAKI